MNEQEQRGPDGSGESHIKNPPGTFLATMKSLGPGMILTGSIVGSGELIATTKVGADTGFWLLWVIIIGCVIKVFTQIEFGRYAVTHSETTLKALNGVPGPRIKANWIVWLWVLMTLFSVGQMGGIVGAIGQALSITKPLTEEGRSFNERQNALIHAKISLAESVTKEKRVREETPDDREKLAAVRNEVAQKQALVLSAMNIEKDEEGRYVTDEEGRYVLVPQPAPIDTPVWGSIVAIMTAFILYAGRYRFIKVFSTFLVVGFTIITMVTLLMLQGDPTVAISSSELMGGLSFKLPPDPSGTLSFFDRFGPALAAFGIIGVGAAELIMYPYWCLEQGYARACGENDGSESWIKRAKGWMKVMCTDAWLSMIVYTSSTIAFLLLGAAVLNRIGLNPDGGDLVRVLSEMYVPVFGAWAKPMFLIGSIAVLYSTFLVASDGNSRLTADCLGIFGLHKNDEETHRRWSRRVSFFWPLLCMATFLLISNNPATLVLAAGSAQAIMLPILGGSALYFRHRKCHEELKPGKVFDVFLWLSVMGFAVVGIYKLIGEMQKLMS